MIKPEWIPSGYHDKTNENLVVEVTKINYSLNNRKPAPPKTGFKREVSNKLTN